MEKDRQNKGRLLLIPSPIGDNDPAGVIPGPVLETLRGIRVFVVEEVRTARRYLSRAGLKGHIDSLEFHELNEHTRPEEIEGYIRLFDGGTDVVLTVRGDGFEPREFTGNVHEDGTWSCQVSLEEGWVLGTIDVALRDADGATVAVTECSPKVRNKGTNLVSGAAVSCSTTYRENDYGAHAAADSDLSTRWAPLDSDPAPWIQADFGSEKAFDTVILSEWLDTNTGDYRCTGVNVQYSADGEEWKTFYEGDAVGQELLITGEAVSARYVRVNLPGMKTVPASLYEFEVYPAKETPAEPSEPVSKATLEYFLNKAKSYVEDGTVSGLVESIRKMFTDAIAKGEAVMADENATREEVLDAAADLMFAVHALDMKAADKTDLEMALELAEMIDLSKYVEAGQAEFLAAKDAAEAVMADGDALQTETDEAWNTLVEAMNALRLKADKSVLEDLISQMEELDLSGYTEESVSVFRAAFAAANAVLTDEALSADDQAEVDEAVNALQAAYDGLEKTQSDELENPGTGSGDADDPQDPGSNPGSGDADDTQTTDGDSGKAKAAKTGDAAPIAASGVILVLSAMAVIMLGRKRIWR